MIEKRTAAAERAKRVRRDGHILRLLSSLWLSYALRSFRRAIPANDNRPVPNSVQSYRAPGTGEYPIYSCAVPPQLCVPAIGV